MGLNLVKTKLESKLDWLCAHYDLTGSTSLTSRCGCQAGCRTVKPEEFRVAGTKGSAVIVTGEGLGSV